MYAKVMLGALAAIGASVLNIASAADVRVAEIHYDNTGTDVAEAIEVSGPAGMDVTGWRVVLYNGNGGASYNTQTLTGAIPATCSTRGVIVLNYPVNGVQNGGAGIATEPDGVALVDASGAVVEFLSYEGAFVASNGPAMGVLSTDIGVGEAGNEPAGLSLARNAAGTWSGPAANTFGACNDNGATPPPPEVTSVVVAPLSATIIVGGTQTFTASALDASSQPINGVTFTWSSNAPAIATVNANGVATGVAPGDATITATAPNGIAGAAALHVNQAPPTGGIPEVRFSELHYDNVGTDAGESIEIEGPAGTDVTGYTVVLYNGNGGASYNTQTLSGTIPATCSTRGVLTLTYPQDGIQNGSPDGMALVNASGQVLEFLSYEGTFSASNGPAAGAASTDIIASETNAALGQSLQRDASNVWTLAGSSFGTCNSDGPGNPPTGNTISFSGRLATDPPLPVGFEDQLFANVRDSNNQPVVTTITWTSETPDIATIDQNGVMHAVAAGSARFRATAADGVTTSTFTLPMAVAVASTTALYANNAEFGEPTDNDPSDDFIVHYSQYTASYNNSRGSPNWVSYELDPTHFGPEDRCDCFTMDPALPASFTHLTTNDYTGAGAIAGYGIDRGHMTRSFDRTSGSLDNAVTYLFSNVVPQAADMNQGPWAILENDLGDFARFQNKEVYIVTGPAGNKGTLKNEGKVVIPTSTWKVAVIMDHDEGLADVHSSSDVQIIAVNMPNDPGVRNVQWQTYQTTVDAIETLTGYDLLAALPNNIERAVESNTQPPEPVITGTTTTTEGGSVALSGAASSDPNGTIVSFAWNFGDGANATGADVTHGYGQDGVYTVTLTATDNDGLTSDVTTTITVANVAPVIADFPGGTLQTGQTYTAAGSFTDPGSDTWTATVDWGDGSTVSTSALAARNFSLTHTYTTPGTFTVTVSIADDDVTSTRTQTVTVTQPANPLSDAKNLVDGLVAANKLPRAIGALLKAEIAAGQALIDRDRPVLAAAVLVIAVIDIDVLVRVRVLSAADAAPLRTLLVGVIASLRN